ncbi:PaaI family thioesterase, partial [Escherichia coli]
PTAISETLKFKLTGIDHGEAHVSLKTDVNVHANQQGTVHGGMLCELADAAIGTAHSTVIEEGESFTSIELKINFLRPVWNDTLVAYAKPIQRGRT